MTVCIAGICNANAQPMIVVVADRMITASDMQYEPEQAKLYRFNNHTAALIAGDAAPQMAICDATYHRVAAVEKPSVRQVAEIFAEEHATYRRLEAEQIFLLPLGMNVTSFMQNQKNLNAKFVTETVQSLQNHDIGNTQTIILGFDDIQGCQIFQINKWGVVRSENLSGFSTAGIGEWHASSYLMLVGYHRFWSTNRALFQLYYAKRKAEAAPGIGRSTDLYFINEHGIQQFDLAILEMLRANIDEMEKNIGPIVTAALGTFDTELTSFLEQKAAKSAKVEAERSQPIESAAKGEDTNEKTAANIWTGPTIGD